MQRRLSVVVSADVAGYSRLMGRDEAGTLTAFKARLNELILPTLAGGGGRVVKTTGDGILMEFSSVVDATRSMIDIQIGMRDRNAGVPVQDRLEFRIGINLGDILIDSDDIHGDGVNIAARLQEAAKPGGICVSDRVYEDIRDRLQAQFTDGGEQSLKNIARPMHVWSWMPPGLHAAPPADATQPLALPDKPSVAVLPFTNMSGDPEQDYFADGMVEDITTALSRFHYIFVIARNSSFTYKGRTPDIKQVGRELGVRYVLEGSVRKAGRRVRITGQLIEAASGSHIWADRIDGDLDDIFALQDRVTTSVVAAIAPKLRAAEIDRARRKPTDSLQAYDLFLRALAYMHGTDRASMAEGMRLADAAIILDPGYAMAMAVKARMLFRRMVQRHVPPGDPSVDEGVVLARRAAALSPDDHDVLWLSGFVIALGGGDFATALDLIDRSLALNENASDALATSGLLGAYRGDRGRAVPHLERASRLNPLSNDGYIINQSHALLHFAASDYRQSLLTSERAIRAMPGHLPARSLQIASLGRLGRIEEGRAAVQGLLAIAPNETLAAQRRQFAHLFDNPSMLDAYMDGLRQCGLPEGG